VRYGLFMARNEDETGAGGESAGWLGRVCAKLKAKVDEAVEALCEARKVEGVAGAEKLARAAGVIARAAKAVAALEPRLAGNSEEDEMGGRSYDPEETERLRRELEANCDRLDGILEEKRAEAAERARLKAARAAGEDLEAPG
jgi:hypothetical protein